MIDHALNILTTGSVFFTVAVGLLIILSVMGVVNLAHGAFMTIGGYAAVIVSDQGWNPWWSLLLAPTAGFVLGLATERVLVRRLYGRPLDTILATWGLSIVVVQVLSDHFGRSSHFVEEIVSGDPIEFAGTFYSQYRAFIVIVAVCLSLGLTAALRYTNVGIIARAVILNPGLARVLGINTGKVNAVTFACGSALAAFAGAVIVPMSSVDPNMGTPWVITAFMVVLGRRDFAAGSLDQRSRARGCPGARDLLHRAGCRKSSGDRAPDPADAVRTRRHRPPPQGPLGIRRCRSQKIISREIGPNVRFGLPMRLGIGLLLVGIVVPAWTIDDYTAGLLVQAFLFAILALTTDVVWGYSGILTFASAAMFGIGAYALGIVFVHLSDSAWAVALAALVTAVAAAAL